MFFMAEDDVAAVVAATGAHRLMDRLIAEIRQGFAAMAQGRVEHVVRTGFSQGRNLFEWMPVRFRDGNAVLKLVSYCPVNPLVNGLPTVNALIAEVDPEFGEIRTLAEGRLLTAMRTGAASAVATRIMARSDSAVLGLIGCGLQSVTHAHALSRVLPLQRILAFDVDAAVLATLPSRLAFLGIGVEAATPERLAREADVICTATSNEVGAGPVVPCGSLRSHAHINAVGSDFPGKMELPADLVRSAFVAADFVEQAAREGECQHFSSEELSDGRVVALADLVRGGSDLLADLPSRITVFDSTGVAMEDAAALKVVSELARATGRGRELGAFPARGDPHDPYGAVSAALAEFA